MTGEAKGFRVIPGKTSEETTANAGFRVVVTNPKTIYQAIPRAARRDLHYVVLQDDPIKDELCSGLTTKLSAYDHKSSYNPGTYTFSSVMDFKGRKPGRLSFSSGYVNAVQLQQIQKGVIENGGVSLTPYDLDGLQVLNFTMPDENYYRLALGFPDEATHKAWIEAQIQKEMQEGRMGYYRAHPNLLKSRLVNDNLELGSQYFPYPQDLDLHGVFDFSNKVQQYAKVYEMFVKLIYGVNSLPEPNKTVTLKAGF